MPTLLTDNAAAVAARLNNVTACRILLDWGKAVGVGFVFLGVGECDTCRTKKSR